MKLITAVIKPFKVDEVRQAVADIGIQGVTVTEVHGCGALQHHAGFMSKAKVELAVDDSIADYLLQIVEETRKHPDIVLAASTRAALGLYRAAQAHALLDGRDFTVPDDVKVLAEPVLAHRLVSRGWSAGGHPDAAPFVREILQRVEVPR